MPIERREFVSRKGAVGCDAVSQGRHGPRRVVHSRGYHRTWSAVTLKDMARVSYLRAFIDLLVSNPPFKRPT